MCGAGVKPPPGLLEALLRRAEVVLGDMTCKELGWVVGALAELRFRPTDAWLEGFVAEVGGPWS